MSNTEFKKFFEREFHRLPVWVPGVDMAIGDIGIVHDGEWTKVSDLEEQKMEFDIDRGDGFVNYDYTTGRGVDFTSGISGEGDLHIPHVAAGNVGVKVEFSSESAFALQAPQCRVDRINSLDALGREMLRRYYDSSERWEEEWVVATEVVVAKRYLLAVSAGGGGSAGFDLGAKVGPGGLLDAGVGARVAYRQNGAGAWLSLEPQALMFNAVKADINLLWPDSVGPVLAVQAPRFEERLPAVIRLTPDYEGE